MTGLQVEAPYAGTKLCVAGTMDDNAAIVFRSTFGYRLIQAGAAQRSSPGR